MVGSPSKKFHSRNSGEKMVGETGWWLSQGDYQRAKAVTAWDVRLEKPGSGWELFMSRDDRPSDWFDHPNLAGHQVY